MSVLDIINKVPAHRPLSLINDKRRVLELGWLYVFVVIRYKYVNIFHYKLFLRQVFECCPWYAIEISNGVFYLWYNQKSANYCMGREKSIVIYTCNIGVVLSPFGDIMWHLFVKNLIMYIEPQLTLFMISWVMLTPDGPHVGPMNLAIRDYYILRKGHRFLRNFVAYRAWTYWSMAKHIHVYVSRQGNYWVR